MVEPDNNIVSTMEQILEEVRAGNAALATTGRHVARLANLVETWLNRTATSNPDRHGTPDSATAADGPGEARPKGLPSAPAVTRRSPCPDGVDYLRLIAHDLKEPLRGIAYFSQLLEEDYGHELEQEGLGYLGYIKAAARRMSMLLTDATLLSRLQHQPLNPQPTDLEAQVNALIEEFRSEIEAKQGRIVREGEFPVLYCDTAAIHELLRRLIQNAVQYSVIPAEIRIRVDGPESGVYTFMIQDRGIGIESEYLDKVFDLFYRLHSWETFEGTGAGLTICKQVVEAHGGTIWIESAVGQGTTVHFTLADTTDIVRRLSAESDVP